MNFDAEQFQQLVHRFHLGALSADEFADFENTIKAHSEAREVFRKSCRLDTLLRRQSEKIETTSITPIQQPRKKIIPMAAAAVAILCTVIGLLMGRGGAQIASLDNAKWSSESYAEGDVLKAGTNLTLESGKATILFDSGATTELTGPAKFKIKSSNSGYLALGSASSIASNPESKGFTIKTPITSLVDMGTAFQARVNEREDSHIAVTNGEVGVKIGSKQHDLTEGMALEVKAGNPSIIIRIDKGKGDPDFTFPTVQPPSSKDFADSSNGVAKVKIRGRLGLSSQNDANEANLTDGQGQRNGQQPAKSFFFRNDEIGSIIFDLGSTQRVAKINTYSWHKPANKRALNSGFQHYIVWASNDEDMPDISDSPELDGWKYITEVNSDHFFNLTNQADRPNQQGCSIEGASGIIGKYRYLYFDVKSSNFTTKSSKRFNHNNAHTMFGEIDIWTEQ